MSKYIYCSLPPAPGLPPILAVSLFFLVLCFSPTTAVCMRVCQALLLPFHTVITHLYIRRALSHSFSLSLSLCSREDREESRASLLCSVLSSLDLSPTSAPSLFRAPIHRMRTCTNRAYEFAYTRARTQGCIFISIEGEIRSDFNTFAIRYVDMSVGLSNRTFNATDRSNFKQQFVEINVAVSLKTPYLYSEVQLTIYKNSRIIMQSRSFRRPLLQVT